MNKLEKINVSLLEKERLIGIESQQTRFVETQKSHGGNLVLEVAKETERSGIFKTNNFSVYIGMVLLMPRKSLQQH